MDPGQVAIISSTLYVGVVFWSHGWKWLDSMAAITGWASSSWAVVGMEHWVLASVVVIVIWQDTSAATGEEHWKAVKIVGYGGTVSMAVSLTGSSTGLGLGWDWIQQCLDLISCPFTSCMSQQYSDRMPGNACQHRSLCGVCLCTRNWRVDGWLWQEWWWWGGGGGGANLGNMGGALLAWLISCHARLSGWCSRNDPCRVFSSSWPRPWFIHIQV